MQTSNRKGFFITGTDTGVGKTIVTATLLSLFKKRNVDAGVMKPVETGVGPQNSSPGESDAHFLMQTGGIPDGLEEVSPYRFKLPAAPYLAAQSEGRTIDKNTILKSFHNLAPKHDIMLVEGVGGILAPVTPDYKIIDLAWDMGLPLIVVSRAGLGTINHTLLTLHAARSRGLIVTGVIFNHLHPEENRLIANSNRDFIHENGNTRILGEIPFIPGVSPEHFDAKLIESLEDSLDLKILLKEVLPPVTD